MKKPPPPKKGKDLARMSARFKATMEMQRPYDPEAAPATPDNKKPAEVAGSLRPVARADH